MPERLPEIWDHRTFLSSGMRASVGHSGTYDNGKLWIADCHETAFEARGLTTFDGLFNNPNARIFKKKADRDIATFSLCQEPAAPRFFMKRHYRPAAPLAAAGPAEWRKILAVRAVGIECLEPVAAGYDPSTGQSLLVTREVPRGQPLDKFLLANASDALGRGERCRVLRQLPVAAARLVRVFHNSGFNHRDLYLCHIFIRLLDQAPGTLSPEPFQLVLIDLQRVDFRRRFRWRWIVKDLAEMYYSAWPLPISRTDMLRFLHNYWQTDRLDSRMKRIVKRIARKANGIARHDRAR